MTTHSTSGVRRYAAVGTVAAMLVGSAAIGIGATAAHAADTADASTAAPMPGGPTPAGATPTSTPTATATPAAAPTPAPAVDAAPAGAGAANPAAAADATSAAAADATPAAAADATPAGTVAIAGTLTAWQTLTADTAGWPEGTAFTYAWHLHHPDLADGAPVTDRTYVVSPEETGGTLDVTVTGTAPGMAPTTVTSAPSTPVVAGPEDQQYRQGERTVRVTLGEPFSIALSPAPNPDLVFFVNGQAQGTPDPSVLPDGVTLSRDGVLAGTLTSAAVPGEVWVHVSTSRHPDGGLSERLLLVGETDEYDAPLQFGEESTADARIELTAEAGEPFAHTFATTGGTGPVRYEFVEPRNNPLPDGSEIDPATGVFRVSSTSAAWYTFQVVATSGDERVVAFARLIVRPAAAVGLRVSVDLADDPALRNWSVESDGSVSSSWFPQPPQAEPVRSTGDGPTVRQGGALLIKAAPVDRFGNYTGPLDFDDPDEWVWPDVRSDVASDQVARDGYSVRVTFPHASTHTLTVTTEGVSTTFPVTVVPTTNAGGLLAFTGADPSAPLTWALGLLSAGAVLLVHRLRGLRRLRRRA